MGSVYLSYSAFYISSSNPNIRNTISMIINMLYVLLFVIVMRNSLNVLALLRVHYQIVRNSDAGVLEANLQLKISMMKKFMLLMIMYYFYEVVIYGIIPMASTDFIFESNATIFH
jgi:hypothetical protein